jgi:hypothetical protein
LHEEKIEAEQAKLDAAKKRAEEEAAIAENIRKENLPPEELEKEAVLALDDQDFAALARNLAEETEKRQRAMIDLLRNDKLKRDVWKRWVKKKPDLAKSVADVVANLNLPPLP